MKKIAVLTLTAALTLAMHAQQAKYVFYFIGDGMGVNQINATEMYLAEKNGRIGTESLLMTTFPVVTVATSYSATNSVTDSSAGGTALATGQKTYNGAIGVDANREPITSVAQWAKESGKRVGVLSSVSIDHATPAAFYAHQPDRNMYYEIATDLPKAGFDFYGGSGFLVPDKKGQKNIYTLFKEAGYTVAKGLKDYNEKAQGAKKLILMQEEGAEADALPFAIDRKSGDMTLADLTRSAIDFLTKGDNKGFFLMVEGGKIDWACHSNDPATAFEEVVDMDQAVKVAYDFYKKHPKETLIAISADHETGGIVLGTGRYELKLKALACQRQSVDELSHAVTDLRKEGKTSWDNVKSLLAEKMGFWTELPLTWDQEKALFNAYGESMVDGNPEFEESLYSRIEPLAWAAKKVMSQIAMVGWASGGHSGGYVPVFAIGAGSEKFQGKRDNTDIAKTIRKVAGYK